MARPSLYELLARVDEQVEMLYSDHGGLPRAVEADEILREIWIEDTHHSSALEGNPLSRSQVARLLNEGHAAGTLSASLEVEGYARAARWVYEEAPNYRPIDGVPHAVIRELHRILVEPAWVLDPPQDHSRPGDFRKMGSIIKGSKVKTVPPIAIQGAIADWVEASARDAAGLYNDHQLMHVADMHAWFERVHPYADGNGRTGRLIMNFMLIQRGYPPAVLAATSRTHYLHALQLADKGNTNALCELIARAIESSINRFLIPKLAGDAKLIPLASLAEGSEYASDYLRTLAVSGRLRAVKEGQIWLSCRNWLEDYRKSRNARGRKPAA